MEPESYIQLKQEITERMLTERALLDQLRNEIRPYRNDVRPIYQRTTTAMSLVATDGCNTSIRFDPFLVQIVRVVDSSNLEYCLEAITPTTDITALSRKQFHEDGSPKTALGEMMAYLKVQRLQDLSPMIRDTTPGRPISPSWVQVYRELVEWAILFDVTRRDFGSDTLIVYDGLLRSKVFTGDLFRLYLHGIEERFEELRRRNRRRMYLTGVAKHSKVLDRYRLAMALEGILTTNYAAYLPISREIEEKAYIWAEYARGRDQEREGEEVNKFVGGKMFFVKFGKGLRDPIWPIDICEFQVSEVQHILGCMLSDALNGFPVPLYPQCLQKAHSNAALVDFDFDILQDQIFDGIRAMLAEEAPVLDVFRLQDADPAQRRYE